MKRLSVREQMVRDALTEAHRHAGMPIKVIEARRVPWLRRQVFFIPTCRYSEYWSVQRGEIGVLNGIKYKSFTRKGEQ